MNTQDQIAVDARLYKAFLDSQPASVKLDEIDRFIVFQAGRRARVAHTFDSQSTDDEPTARESLIACLGDDAATLSAANPDDELAQTMREAAAMLERDGEGLDQLRDEFASVSGALAFWLPSVPEEDGPIKSKVLDDVFYLGEHGPATSAQELGWITVASQPLPATQSLKTGETS